jgi:hypothetical protein
MNKHWLIPNHQPLICVLLVSQGYLAYIRGLPITDTPEIFGLHDNANISFAQNEAFALLGAVVQLQPKAAASGGKAREEVLCVLCVSSPVSTLAETLFCPIWCHVSS